MDGSTLPKMDDFDKTEGAILALYREVGGKCTLRNKIVCKKSSQKPCYSRPKGLLDFPDESRPH